MQPFSCFWSHPQSCNEVLVEDEEVQLESGRQRSEPRLCSRTVDANAMKVLGESLHSDPEGFPRRQRSNHHLTTIQRSLDHILKLSRILRSK
jgi:hypothetical protein